MGVGEESRNIPSHFMLQKPEISSGLPGLNTDLNYPAGEQHRIQEKILSTKYLTRIKLVIDERILL